MREKIEYEIKIGWWLIHAFSVDVARTFQFKMVRSQIEYTRRRVSVTRKIASHLSPYHHYYDFFVIPWILSRSRVNINRVSRRRYRNVYGDQKSDVCLRVSVVRRVLVCTIGPERERERDLRMINRLMITSPRDDNPKELVRSPRSHVPFVIHFTLYFIYILFFSHTCPANDSHE